MIIKDLFEIKNYIELKKKDINNRNIRIYNFNNVVLTGKSIFYPDILLKSKINNYLVLPIKEMTMSLNKKSYYEENGMLYNFIQQEYYNNIKIDVYFFIYNIQNYYHFIYDTLPYLYSFFKLRKKNKDIKLLMSYNELLPFVNECLELLDIHKNDIIIHNKNNIYNNLYLGNSLTHDGLSNNAPRKEIFEIYNIMINNALSKSINHNLYYEKIYISRRSWINNKLSDNIGTNYTTRRKLMNEDDLVKILNNNNFTEIFGENYSMIEKIKLFYNAKFVIGAIGSTIINCLFCNKNCKIITLVSPYFLDINYRIIYLFNKNYILFKNTSVYCNKNEIPINVRIEVIDSDSEYYKNIGEIVNKHENDYLVKIANNYIGLNNNEKYKKILLKEYQFKKLDNGINSPWTICIHSLLNYL